MAVQGAVCLVTELLSCCSGTKPDKHGFVLVGLCMVCLTITSSIMVLLLSQPTCL